MAQIELFKITMICMILWTQRPTIQSEAWNDQKTRVCETWMQSDQKSRRFLQLAYSKYIQSKGWHTKANQLKQAMENL